MNAVQALQLVSQLVVVLPYRMPLARCAWLELHSGVLLQSVLLVEYISCADQGSVCESCTALPLDFCMPAVIRLLVCE